jgi:hypothetical protein
MGGLRCDYCAEENYLNWLVRLGDAVRDGVPDGHTPAMSQQQRGEHNSKVADLKKKVKALRKKYPKRYAAYKAKNKGDLYGEAVEV